MTAFPNAYGPPSKDKKSIDEEDKPAGFPARGAGGKNVCFEFRDSGKCKRGDRCKFSHEAADPAAAKKADKLAAAAAERRWRCQRPGRWQR